LHMSEDFRWGFTAADKTLLWDRWQQGGVIVKSGV